MNTADAIRFRATAGRAAAESFYHLADRDVTRMHCNGLACFVARHLKPAEWSQAERQAPPLHCLGHCYAAPANGSCREQPNIQCPAPEPIVLSRILRGGARTLERYQALGGYRALSAALHRPPEEIIQAVEESQLRGRGGAAFPTGQKWRSAAAQAAEEKFVVVNGDEGDAGAYVDRFLMEDDPFAVIEGATLAAHAIGAKRGFIYIRAEYPQADVSMRSAIEEAYDGGFLGGRILGTNFSFELEVVSGKGSYVCGEETALVRSIEGLRPQAEIRPPFCSERGLFGSPTIINNIETLVNVPWIVLNTGAAFAAFGFGKSRGTKVISLNSLFRRPGLYEVEFGIRVRDIVEELGGGLKTGAIKGLIIGGPLAGLIPPQLFDTLFGFEELRTIGASVGHGGVVAFDESTSIAELVHHVFAFGAFESCGKCAPCRLGAKCIEEIFASITHGIQASSNEQQEWQEIRALLKSASLCGHGAGLGEFADSTVRYYRKELDACFA
jgi:NADH:ubiquinone oxidoreductase subunit F (NADH-binding)